MGKRSPIGKGGSGTVYVFLAHPRIVLKITVEETRAHSWYDYELNMPLGYCDVAVAEYQGASNLVYFPDVNRVHTLLDFSCQCIGKRQQWVSISLDGVTKKRLPGIDLDSLEFSEHTDAGDFMSYLHELKPTELRFSVNLRVKSDFQFFVNYQEYDSTVVAGHNALDSIFSEAR
jgi:hypothetical protein